MILVGEKEKKEFILRTEKLKQAQKDERVKNLIDQYRLFRLHITSSVDTDLPRPVVDQVAGIVTWIWNDVTKKHKRRNNLWKEKRLRRLK